MTTRLSFFLLIALLLIVTFARGQGSATARSPRVACRIERVGLLQNKLEISALTILDPRSLLAAFSSDETTELFADIAIGKAEEAMLRVYYHVSALPLNERKAAFRNASSNDKSGLWRTHLALVLAKHPDLNERQKKIILAAMSLATSEHFEVRSNDADWKTKGRDPLRSLEEQIVGAFSLEDAAKIFATLGDDGESDHSARYTDSVLLKNISYKTFNQIGEQGKDSDKKDNDKKDTDKDKGKDKDRTPGQEMERGRSYCQCSTVSDYCPIWSICTTGNCTSTSSGCGTFWSHPCNGSCRGT